MSGDDKWIEQIEGFTVETKINPGAPKTEIESSDGHVIKNVSSAEEMRQVIDGNKLNIIMDVSDRTAKLTGDEQSKFDAALAAEQLIAAQYVDISLYKNLVLEDPKPEPSNKLGDDPEPEYPMQVHETEDPIELKVTLNDDIVAQDTYNDRDYYIFRHHDGVVEKIPCEYDRDTQSIKFASDKFSDYAIAYYAPEHYEANANAGDNNV